MGWFRHTPKMVSPYRFLYGRFHQGGVRRVIATEPGIWKHRPRYQLARTFLVGRGKGFGGRQETAISGRGLDLCQGITRVDHGHGGKHSHPTTHKTPRDP